jgi:ATP-dependent RNA helicase DHX29
MAKKKSKIVSNRGFATTSAPSKKAEVPVAPTIAEKAQEPTPPPPPPQQQEKQPFENLSVTDSLNMATEDEISTLVTKYASLHEHKAQAALERLIKDDPQWQQLSEERIKKFRLSADLEKDLLQVIKHRHGDIFGKCRSHVYTDRKLNARF